MDFLSTLKLDSWWKVVLWCGVALVAAALIFNIEVVNRKHLIGLGLGMFLVGISNFAAIHTIVIRENLGQWTALKPIHNTKTKTVLYIGWGIIVVFGMLLLCSLI
jgi:hypothetical protein